ncbi:hypothetical protein CBR_g31311 [Chara braunii]|uniref:Uncharacterized protein n=1 Tax=Chara braunii TaxID=69332 RepID=A0A388LEM0_CHABU|nr:hypothetical protein CBR_g31311 [Chara braunii]|eukprot:GBG80756.1 hypothetical protein CBR_g31311 [Chara braunii]
MMMNLAFAVGGGVGDWSTVVPRPVVDVYGEEVGEVLVRALEKMSVMDKGMSSNLVFDAELSKLRILDRVNGMLLPLERANIFRNWTGEKLRASFEREHRLGSSKGLDVLFEFFNRNAFCVVEKLSSRGRIWVVERGMVERMLDHWILGEPIAGFAVAKKFGKSVDELVEGELVLVKESCEAESKAWKGKGRWEFVAVGLIIAFAGSSRKEVVSGLLKGMKAIEWEGFGILQVIMLIKKTLKEAKKEERETIRMEDLFKFGEGTWITNLGCKRLGKDFNSIFAGGGGANLNFVVSWRSVTERPVPNERPIFIPLQTPSEQEEEDHGGSCRRRQISEHFCSPPRKLSPPNSPPESGRYLDVS